MLTLPCRNAKCTFYFSHHELGLCFNFSNFFAFNQTFVTEVADARVDVGAKHGHALTLRATGHAASWSVNEVILVTGIPGQVTPLPHVVTTTLTMETVVKQLHVIQSHHPLKKHKLPALKCNIYYRMHFIISLFRSVRN
jgi:hypothetical protein